MSVMLESIVAASGALGVHSFACGGDEESCSGDRAKTEEPLRVAEF